MNMTHERIISVIGLGYVGLTTAGAFSKIGKVIAFDTSPTRIKELQNGHDKNDEVPDHDLSSPNIYFTTNISDLKEADFHIITVPTPLDITKHPDLSMLLNASEQLGKQLKIGDIVVYESTVYPGATEEKCIPVLEKFSNLTHGKDFFVGFSPERINPADKNHVFANIVKVVSGTDNKTLDIIADVYSCVVKAGVHRASSIRVAEACKVIENTQRDVNIALMNEIAIMLHKFGIDTAEVISAMKTKWNFLPFQPGLVGGHCIGVNPYYLMHKAQEVGYHSEIISAGRRANENISKFIVDEAIKCLINQSILIKESRIAILGLTYKENCSDVRDTRVIDIINSLKSYGIEVLVNDPIADRINAKKDYGIELVSWESLSNLDAIILTVAHNEYLSLTKNDFLNKLKKNGTIMDIKEILSINEFYDTGVKLWRL
jgi:UDP-N-acetyl-D-galactosamine dehydrogenase